MREGLHTLFGSPYRHMRPFTRCVFCGSREGLTKEHVFSRWTHRYLPPRRPGRDLWAHGTAHVGHAEVVKLKLPGETRDWQLRCVCGGNHRTCNGGWMKRIEDAAKLAMVPLINGEAVRITPAQQRTIAAWAAVKCIVVECAHDGRPIAHHAQRKRLMRLQLPPARGWAVWIGHFERERWPVDLIFLPFQVTDEEKARIRRDKPVTHYNSNATTQVVGKLLIHVMHAPSTSLVEQWRFALLDGGALYRIWPPSGHSIKWPGRPLTDGDVAEIAIGLHAFLLDIARQAGRG